MGGVENDVKRPNFSANFSPQKCEVDSFSRKAIIPKVSLVMKNAARCERLKKKLARISPARNEIIPCGAEQ